ncbi:hypothetical protein GCM10010531_09930 [Blastococcus jejuensis]|uniref:Uncharacterized protein n=1 Tax=Blastococcus jejuensis TaxID=351224 RepID=A0ABP6NX18_9ACTN
MALVYDGSTTRGGLPVALSSVAALAVVAAGLVLTLAGDDGAGAHPAHRRHPRAGARPPVTGG